MASVDNPKLRDVMGNDMYPMVLDSNNVDMKTVVNNLKDSLNNIDTSIDDINTNIQKLLDDIDDFIDYLNQVIKNIDKRLSQIDGSDDIINNDGVMRLYVGASDLYVDHKYTGTTNDGSQSKPFSSFAQLNNYLKMFKIMNRVLNINVVTTGEYNESLEMSGYTGGGIINIIFNNSGYLIVNNTREFGIKLSDMKIIVVIKGYRIFDTVHGILCYRCRSVYVQNSVLSSKTTGIRYENSCGDVQVTDFSNVYCAIDVYGPPSNVYVKNCSGNCTVAFRVQRGSTLHYGVTTSTQPIPQGQINEIEGRIFQHGTTTPTASWAYPNAGSKPTPSTSATLLATFNFTSRGSYRPSTNTWWDLGCISGVYRDEPESAGHIFFNLSEIKAFLNTGTVIDGASITINRNNSTGGPQSTDIWIGGSSASNPSGTPVYGNRAKVGRLSWGETKTFPLSKAIVDGIKAGTYKSITTYGSGYTDIKYAVIILKIRT